MRTPMDCFVSICPRAPTCRRTAPKTSRPFNAASTEGLARRSAIGCQRRNSPNSWRCLLESAPPRGGRHNLASTLVLIACATFAGPKSLVACAMVRQLVPGGPRSPRREDLFDWAANPAELRDSPQGCDDGGSMSLTSSSTPGRPSRQIAGARLVRSDTTRLVIGDESKVTDSVIEDDSDDRDCDADGG